MDNQTNITLEEREKKATITPSVISVAPDFMWTKQNWQSTVDIIDPVEIHPQVNIFMLDNGFPSEIIQFRMSPENADQFRMSPEKTDHNNLHWCYMVQILHQLTINCTIIPVEVSRGLIQ